MRTRLTFMVLVSLVVLGCTDSPTEPKTDPCPGLFNCPGGESLAHPSTVPNPDEVYFSAVRGRDKLRAEVEAGTVKLTRQVNWEDLRFLERTVFLACPFWVSNPDSNPNGVGGDPTCADGKYSPKTDSITVTTWYGHARTMALIEWETRNRFLVLGGRSDLAH